MTKARTTARKVIDPDPEDVEAGGDAAMSGRDRAAIEAAGRACAGLGDAILGLGRAGLAAEARELAQQLKFLSKDLGWIVRRTADRFAPQEYRSAQVAAATTHRRPSDGNGSR